MRQPWVGTQGPHGVAAEIQAHTAAFAGQNWGTFRHPGPDQDPAASVTCWCGLTLMSQTDTGRRWRRIAHLLLPRFRKLRAGRGAACWVKPELNPGSGGPLKAPDASFTFGPWILLWRIRLLGITKALPLRAEKTYISLNPASLRSALVE